MNTAPIILMARPSGMAVQVVVRPGAFIVPPNIASNPVFQRTRGTFLDRIAQGSGFDGPVLFPVGLQLGEAGVYLEAQASSYSVSVGLDAVNRGTPSLPLLPMTHVPTGALGIDTLVISADSQVLTAQRPASTVKWPGQWFLGFGEGLEVTDVGDIRGAAARCMQEELALPVAALAAERLQVVAFGRECSFVAWTAYAVLDLRGLGPEHSAASLVARASQAHDAWEAQNLCSVPLGDVPRFFQGRRWIPPTSVFLNSLNALSK